MKELSLLSLTVRYKQECKMGGSTNSSCSIFLYGMAHWSKVRRISTDYWGSPERKPPQFCGLWGQRLGGAGGEARSGKGLGTESEWVKVSSRFPLFYPPTSVEVPEEDVIPSPQKKRLRNEEARPRNMKSLMGQGGLSLWLKLSRDFSALVVNQVWYGRGAFPHEVYQVKPL